MIPPTNELLRPVLECAATREVHLREVTDNLADKFELTEDERRERVASNTQTKLHSRASWARSSLSRAKLIKSTRLGYFTITERGKAVLADPNALSNASYLKQFPEFRNSANHQNTNTALAVGMSDIFEVPVGVSPDEALHQIHGQINDVLAEQLLERIQALPPTFLEILIVDLLRAMGYGIFEEASRVLGRSGDGGVDGVIDQDALGIDQIYVQAKRYNRSNVIGSSAVRDFVGALSVNQAQKGIFVTTSSFSNGAMDAAKKARERIELIDGKRLSKLMVEYEIGCRRADTLIIRKLDEGYFVE